MLSVLEAGSSWIFLSDPSATVSSVLEFAHGQVYSKLNYYSLILNGEAEKNLRIDPGAMILGVTGYVESYDESVTLRMVVRIQGRIATRMT